MQRTIYLLAGRFRSRQFSCSSANQRRLFRGRQLDLRWSGRDQAQQ
jgi:hypothetical protein